MGCLTSARFTMRATIISQAPISSPPVTPTGLETYQDPISGEIIENWTYVDTDDDTPMPTDGSAREVNCLVRGIVDGGIRVAGSTERFGDFYQAVDWAKMWLPANVTVKKNDRVTNIRWGANQDYVYLDDDGNPLQFNVNGAVPLFDAFNRPVEQYILLERVDIRGR